MERSEGIFFERQKTEDEATEAEVFDQHLSEDGRRLNYSVRQADGSVKHLAVPTMQLGVFFTSKGIAERPGSDENH